MAPQVGSEAPDFTLRNQNNEEVTLSEFRGKQNVLVVFYPFAFSGICTGELCAVRDDIGSFQNDDVPLLADFWPHGAVAQAYGVFEENRGMSLRGTFLVDRSGIVRFAEVNQPGEARDQGAWKKAL